MLTTVVVHLEHTGVADAAMMAAVRFDHVAFAAQPNGARVRSTGQR